MRFVYRFLNPITGIVCREAESTVGLYSRGRSHQLHDFAMALSGSGGLFSTGMRLLRYFAFLKTRQKLLAGIVMHSTIISPCPAACALMSSTSR